MLRCLGWIVLLWASSLSSSQAQPDTPGAVLDSVRIEYLYLPRYQADELGLRDGDQVMEPNSFQSVEAEIARVRKHSDKVLGILREQKEQGQKFRDGVDSVLQRMNDIIAEKNEFIQRLNAQLDSTIAAQNRQIESTDDQVDRLHREAQDMIRDSFQAEMEALKTEKHLKQQAQIVDRVVKRMMKKKKRCRCVLDKPSRQAIILGGGLTATSLAMIVLYDVIKRNGF